MAGTLVLDTLQNGAGTYSTSADNVINGCAKAWVNYNGSTQTVNASYNVSSVTYLGAGSYRVNFTNAMASANYAFAGNCQDSTGYVIRSSSGTPPTASAITFEVVNPNVAVGNSPIVTLTIFR